MNTHADKTQKNKSQSVSVAYSQMKSGGESTFQFVDNRPETIVQKKLKEVANNIPQVKQAAQLQEMADNNSSRQHQLIQKKENNTGLPDNLKTGIENLSGMYLDDVKVHRNSDKPAQLQAHAYAQGTDIHLGPGQEKHLPHEAWHVVQQKQGRVKTTMQMKGKVNVNVNDDVELEKEANRMGEKVAINGPTIQQKKNPSISFLSSSNSCLQRQIIKENNVFYTPKFDTIVLQRQIEYNTSKKVYETNSTRPGWRKVAEDALLDEYNLRHDLTLEKVKYAKNKLDRCHIVSFEDIQSQMASYLNNKSSANDFEGFIDIITAHLNSFGSEKVGITSNWQLLKDEMKGSNTSSIVSVANSLLSRLNSISENLRAGNKYLNSYIQQNLDLFFQQSGSGQYQLTDHSRNILSKGGNMVSSVLRTPEHKSRLVTSEGPVPFGSMTPTSKQLTENHPYETRSAKSKNVRTPLYGKQSKPIPVKGYKTSKPVVHPLILKLQPQVDWNKLELVKFRKIESELRSSLDKLLNDSKAAFDYNKLQQHKQMLNQKFEGVNNELQHVNINLNGLVPRYHLNVKRIQDLAQERDTIQLNLKKTSNVNSYELHEQYANYQADLYQSGQTYDFVGYNKSFNEMNRLSSTQADVSDFLIQRQKINTIDLQIYDLQRENDQIESIHQYSQNLQKDLGDLDEELVNVNTQIFYLESNKDVGDFKNLLNSLNFTLTNIGNTEQEINWLQLELSKIGPL